MSTDTGHRQVLLRAASASGGTTKDWQATAYPDRLEIQFGRTGAKRQTRTVNAALCENRSTDDELSKRANAQLADGYQSICERRVDDRGRVLEEQSSRQWHWEREATAGPMNLQFVTSLADLAGVAATKPDAHELVLSAGPARVRFVMGEATAGTIAHESSIVPVLLVLAHLQQVALVLSDGGADHALVGEEARSWARAQGGVFPDPGWAAALEYGGLLPKALSRIVDTKPSGWVFGRRAAS